jgi:mannosyltransferase OCH1-like enzyme
VIPLLVHRIWIGQTIPDEYEEMWTGWIKAHPGWRFHTWRERDLGWLTNKSLFDQMLEPTGKADVARYEILCVQGGVYTDCDVECLRPLDDLLDGVACFAGYEDDEWICNALMGGIKGHPALQRLVDELPGYAAAHEGDGPQIRTGPKFLTDMWKAFPGVTLFPPQTFYPYRWNEADPGPPYPDSYTVHRWAGA